MSTKEKIVEELNELSPSDLLTVRSTIAELKKKHSKKNGAQGKSYLSVQGALKSIKANLSEEIISGRDDRV